MALHASFFTLASLALAACGPRFTNANIEVINKELEKADQITKSGGRDPGVSPKEVESVLGPPKRVETTKLPLETQKKEVEVTRFYYDQDGQTLELHFFDNKLISRLPHLEDKPAVADLTGGATPRPSLPFPAAPPPRIDEEGKN